MAPTLTEEPAPRRRGALLGWVAAACLLLAAAARHAPRTEDDAFITFRYARNVARGLGAVYNAGEHVEGYTNFLWMMLLAGSIRAGGAPVAAAKLLGVAAALGTLVEARKLTTHLGGGSRDALLAVMLLATGPWLPFWAVQGLETPLFALLSTACVRMSVAGEAGGRLGLALALLCMTRPEGLLVALVAIAALATRRPPASPTGATTRALCAFGAIYLPYTAWRLATYGSLLPNTFHAKVALSAPLLWRGLRYVLPWVALAGPALWMAAFPPLGAAGAGRSRRAILALLALYAGYVVAVGGDYMPHHRFLVPLLPVAFASGSVALGQLRTAPARRRRTAALVATAAALLVPMAAGIRAVATTPVRPGTLPDVRLARFLRATAPADASLATTVIGRIGWESDLRILDLMGITDPDVARTPARIGPMAGHDKLALGPALDRRPTFVYFRALVPFEARATHLARDVPEIRPLAEPLVLHDPRLAPFTGQLHRDYRRVELDFGDVRLSIHVRRDVAWPGSDPAPAARAGS